MRFLLLQIRNPDDPMRAHERAAFARTIGCRIESIDVFDVLAIKISQKVLESADVILIGGSGDYSALSTDPWMNRALEGLSLLYESKRPTFASCWGFQAFARALGGEVIHDADNAEVGTHQLMLTEQGCRDPLFGTLPRRFPAQMGHQDHVVRLPAEAIPLARSERVENQAYTFPDRPIYATQFHPELNASDLMDRLRQYPEYLQETTGQTFEEFRARTQESPDAASLLRRFVDMIFSGSAAEKSAGGQ